MSRFDLQSHLNDVYAHYPEADKRPVICITGNYEDLTCKLGRGYYQSVVEAGGVPVVIPPVADKHLEGVCNGYGREDMTSRAAAADNYS